MAGLLTSAQKAIIASGAFAVRHSLYFHVPRSGGATTDFVLVHADGLATMTPLDPKRVTNWGSRASAGFGMSLANAGRLEAGTWSIVVRNDDDYFTPGAAGNVWINPTDATQNAPQSCYLEHDVWIVPDRLDATGTFMLPCSPFTARIVDFMFDAEADAGGNPVGKSAVIICEPAMADILRKRLDINHVWETDTGHNVTVP